MKMIIVFRSMTRLSWTTILGQLLLMEALKRLWICFQLGCLHFCVGVDVEMEMLLLYCSLVCMICLHVYSWPWFSLHNFIDFLFPNFQSLRSQHFLWCSAPSSGSYYYVHILSFTSPLRGWAFSRGYSIKSDNMHLFVCNHGSSQMFFQTSFPGSL